jgi:hypothetical protein
LTLRERHRPRVLENRLLRRICGPKRDEMTKVGENCIISYYIIIIKYDYYYYYIINTTGCSK